MIGFVLEIEILNSFKRLQLSVEKEIKLRHCRMRLESGFMMIKA